MNYLINKGIPSNKIKAEGYGETKPFVPNTSDENRKLNRRIEVKFL
jgi:outer membrane protein OmpA-like peptidoglycan-associated protein